MALMRRTSVLRSKASAQVEFISTHGNQFPGKIVGSVRPAQGKRPESNSSGKGRGIALQKLISVISTEH